MTIRELIERARRMQEKFERSIPVQLQLQEPQWATQEEADEEFRQRITFPLGRQW